MVAAILFQVFWHDISIFIPMLGILMGFFVGKIIANANVYSWKDNQVGSKLDIFGIIVLFLYVALSVANDWLLSLFIQGPAFATLVMAITAGTMLGRSIAMWDIIIYHLRRQGKFPE
jgi:hypothetical protein